MAKEFTEKWLQALTLSVSIPAALRVKPLMNDIDCVSTRSDQAEQEASSRRLWDYAQAQGLGPMLYEAPYRSSPWRFEDEESFVFEREQASASDAFDDWANGLGLRNHSVRLMATVNQEDWSQLLRTRPFG